MKKLLFCCLLILAAACKGSSPADNGQGEQTLVSLDSPERFSDAAVVSVVYAMGPL